MAPTDYLKKRGRIYYVRLQIPERLWAKAGGKREFIKSLKTTDPMEANRLKRAHIAAFELQIRALEREKGNGEKRAKLAELYDKALAWRDAYENAKGEILYEERDGTPYYVTDEFLSQIADQAKEYLETHGEQAADAFFAIAQGKATPLNMQIEPWLAEAAGTITGQTISQHRSALNAYLEWAGDGVAIEEVNRKKAGLYVRYLLSPDSKLSPRTAARHVSSLSALWKHLEGRGLAEDNPWLGQRLGKKSKAGRKAWSDDAIVKVLTRRHTDRYTATMHDLVKLALVTGARLNELCELKAEDVQHRTDGWWISIGQGKTEAAVREIPIHDSAAYILARRKHKAGTYLFDGLIPGGPDHKRSWNVSKAFGLYTRNLLGDERSVFHELRNTFAEAMEAAEVPESTTKLIMGHTRGSMTYGVYSKGARVQLREAIEKLHYSDRVMKLIRSVSVDQPETSKRPAKRK